MSESTNASEDAARLARELAGLVGTEVRAAELGIGSFLTIDLSGAGDHGGHGGHGDLSDRGDWWLWVQQAAWRLEDSTGVLLGSEDPRPYIAEQITVLRGRRITAVTVTAPAMETVFGFDGISLLVFPVHSALSARTGEAYDQWLLWRPQGDILSVSPGPDWAWTTEPSTRDAG